MRGRPRPPSGPCAAARRRDGRAAGTHVPAARGRRRSFDASIATWIVRARSCAEIPVEIPSRASIDTVNAVPYGVSLWSVIIFRPSASTRSPVRQRQMSPRPSFAMNAIASGCRELGRDREVALVLAVGGVDDDDHLPLADVLDRLVDRRELRGAHRFMVERKRRMNRRFLYGRRRERRLSSRRTSR